MASSNTENAKAKPTRNKRVCPVSECGIPQSDLIKHMRVVHKMEAPRMRGIGTNDKRKTKPVTDTTEPPGAGVLSVAEVQMNEHDLTQYTWNEYDERVLSKLDVLPTVIRWLRDHPQEEIDPERDESDTDDFDFGLETNERRTEVEAKHAFAQKQRMLDLFQTILREHVPLDRTLPVFGRDGALYSLSDNGKVWVWHTDENLRAFCKQLLRRLMPDLCAAQRSSDVEGSIAVIRFCNENIQSGNTDFINDFSKKVLDHFTLAHAVEQQE